MCAKSKTTRAPTAAAPAATARSLINARDGANRHSGVMLRPTKIISRYGPYAKGRADQQAREHLEVEREHVAGLVARATVDPGRQHQAVVDERRADADPDHQDAQRAPGARVAAQAPCPPGLRPVVGAAADVFRFC